MKYTHTHTNTSTKRVKRCRAASWINYHQFVLVFHSITIYFAQILWSGQFFTPECVLFYFLELLITQFISHMSTSRTHFSPKGEWLWCEKGNSYGLLTATPFSPSCSRRVLYFPAMISHKGDCEFLPLPFQQKLRKLLYSVI